MKNKYADYLNALLAIKRAGLMYDAEIDEPIRMARLKLREQYRAEEYNRSEFNWHYNDYDSRWGKVVYEGEWGDEEIAEYIDDEWVHYYNPYDDGRDCTGVWFTSWIKVFTVDGKTIIYQLQSCDL